MAKKEKVLYVDMDNVLVDFQSGIDALAPEDKEAYMGTYDNCPHIFSKMVPIKGAIESFKRLSAVYDTYILSTSPWDLMILRPPRATPGRTLFPDTTLFRSDDRTKNGADRFEGELIQFGSDRFPDWDAVLAYLL